MRCLLCLSPLLVVACTAPAPARRTTPWDSAARVLAIDFGPRTARASARMLIGLPGAAVREAARAESASLHFARVAAEGARARHLATQAAACAQDEVSRHPRFAALLPKPEAAAQRLANDLGTLPTLLLCEHEPLGEITDRRHRTDASDDRPQASWLDRLRRRLWL